MRYDRKVIVRASVRVDDEVGGSTETLTDVATWWAKVEPLQDNEQMQALQVGLRNPTRFTGNYRRDITGATELFYQDKRWNVTSVVDPDAQHRQLVILAEEIRG